MCGIAGIWQADPRKDPAAALRRMVALMARRGPDQEGIWTDPGRRMHLGFRRLAILDLSRAAEQPMVASDGRSVLVFNGELYNFRELRSELEGRGVHFRSHGDTEVVLAALAEWGPSAISRFNGMFAFGWYELAEQRLLLGRDHAGIKPLYYASLPGGGFAFASQLDALIAAPGLDADDIDPASLNLYLRLHHLPPPYGLIRHTRQLEPGTWMQVDARGAVRDHRWWSLARRPTPDLRGREADEALASALTNAVRRQLVADVPVGLFLSGGVDSPLVAAVAREVHGAGLPAHTIANPGWGQDEAADAAAYARHLGLEHHVHPVLPAEALRSLPDVIAAQHEPLGDFSVLPTMIISHHARRQVTVALSGDGGDELFFGYERPMSLLRGAREFRLPYPLRVALYAAGKYGIGRSRSRVILAKTPGHYYFSVNSRISEQELARLAPGLPGLPPSFHLYDYAGDRSAKDLADYSRHVEFYGQLQRCLKKVDMASMRESLEVRVPLLDREVIDTSLRIDPFECMRDNRRKALLEDLLARHVPRTLIGRQKRGFAVPLGAWLRDAWRERVEDTLFDRNLSAFFDRTRLLTYWEEHKAGTIDHKWGLWTMLTLEWWRERMRSQRVSSSGDAVAAHTG